MVLDGISLSLVIYEIKKQIIPAQIVDIYQVDQFGILLVLQKNNNYQKIFFSLRADQMAFFISSIIPPENNFTSTFAKQTKSLIQGGKLLNIEQMEFDRIVKLIIQPFQKFGPVLNYLLIIEFMGKHSNAILIDEKGYIITSLKQITSELSRYREIRPGIHYKSPPKQNKFNPLTISKEEFINIWQKKSSYYQIDYLWQLFYQNFQGISPKSATDIVAFCGLPPQQLISELTPGQWIKLWETSLCNFRERVVQHDVVPQLLIDKKSGKIIDYSLLCPTQKKEEIEYRAFQQVSSCLETFYYQINEQEKKQKLYLALDQILKKYEYKLEEKIAFLEKSNKEIENCYQDQKKGELIIANLWKIKSGINSVTLTDYTQPGHPKIKIELNPGLSPLQNAQQFFQRYKKLSPQRERIKKQLLENQKSLRKLKEMQLKLVESRDSLSHLLVFYQELERLNYIKKNKDKKEKNNGKKIPSIAKFTSTDGWIILVGKNNQQNEYLLRYLSGSNDFWLHHQTKPGAHVIIKNHHNLSAPPSDTLHFAARLTGYYSKVKNNEIAPIVYTLRKYVRKPKDAKTGKVVYSQEKIILVLINHKQIREDISKQHTSKNDLI